MRNKRSKENANQEKIRDMDKKYEQKKGYKKES